MRIWYAVMMDEYDNDWGYGSRSWKKAIKMLKDAREIHANAYIAIIADDDDPVCIDEFRL